MNTNRSKAEGSVAMASAGSVVETRLATHGGCGERIRSKQVTTQKWARRTFHSAFTLVEVLVAMAILGVMVAGLLGGLNWCVTSVRLARENLRATQIMVEKMEVIRLLTWDQVITNNVIPARFSAPYYSASGASNDTGGLTYYGQISIRPPVPWQLGTGAYVDDMRVIAVQVLWTNKGQAHQRQLNSYVSRYGIQNYEIN